MNIHFQNSRPIAFSIIFDREEDGRWIAEIPELPGVMAYGQMRNEAKRRAESIALRTLADRIESGRRVPSTLVAAA